MYYSQALLALQNLTNKVNISQAEIGRIIGVTRSAMNGRVQRNSNFTEDEINKLNQFYNVDIRQYMDSHADNVNMITLQPLQASCGNGITIDTSLIDKYDINAQYSIVVAKGTSMTPTINNEDICVIKKFDGNFIDGIYCFSFENDMYIKRLSKNLNQLICTSDNSEFEKIVLKGDELDKINIYGRVVTVIRKFN